MLVSHTYAPLLWVLFSTVSAALVPPLQSINNQLLSPYGSTNRTGIVVVSGASHFSPDSSADLNAIKTQCNGERFGSGLNIASCRTAFDRIIPDDLYSSFGMRYDGTGYDHALPFRWLSGDGECSFELFLISPYRIAYATVGDVKNAAQALLDKCTASSPTKGGVASRIGGDNRLAVVMKSDRYPTVVCQEAPGPPPTIHSRLQWIERCGSIVDGMDATQVTQVFGPRSAPGVQVGLPTGFTDRRCTTLALTIDSASLQDDQFDERADDDSCIVSVVDNGLSDSTSWYKLWEEVSAIVAICVWRGYLGKSVGLGAQGNLAVQLHYNV